MAAHAKPIGMWWLITLAAVTAAVIGVVVAQADSGEASPPAPVTSTSSTPPAGAPSTLNTSP